MHPKKLLLIDGIGALLSAFLLAVILTTFEPVFGMPRRALFYLALLPCFFAAYDFIGYQFLRKNWGAYLRIIAIANLLYCCLSIGFLCCHYEQLTLLGWVYFVLELGIVLVLVWVELKAAAGWRPEAE